ncbi:MAG: ABC transporter substrate-binding protein [Saccharolobus sp.]|uniref:ABC transporter substrate-binding protein n=1 Tax=Saccharolobus sp. TaxID=2100761 RepID=UPI00316AAD33
MKKAISKTIAAMIIAVIIVAIIAVSMAIYLSIPPGASPTSPTTPIISEVKIGVLEPLTGAYAAFGMDAVEGARLAIDIINNELGGVKSLGGAKLKLYVEDVGESPDSAALAAERLISTYRPHAILGAYISRLTAAVAEVTDKEKIPLFMDALVDWLTERGWNYVFRVCPKASIYGRTAAEFVVDIFRKTNISLKTVVILHENSIYGTYVANGIRIGLAAAGIIPNETISYSYRITDFSPIISKLAELNPDVVFSVPYYADALLFARALKASGLYVKFVAGAGGTGYTDPTSISEAGEAVEYFTNTHSYNHAKKTQWNMRIVQKYLERFGKVPSEAAGIAIYTIFFIYEALEVAGKMFPEDPLNPDNLRSVFLSIDLNETNSIAAQLYPTGRIKLAPNGDNLYGATVIVQVINGVPRVVWPEPEEGVTLIFPRPS